MSNKTVDVIIAGAGPAGVSAAITIARGGKKVLLIERGDKVGDKNMFGGCIYENQTSEIFPNFLETAPIERVVTDNGIFLLTEDNSTLIRTKINKNSDRAFTVVRSKWDRWCVERAEEEGVYYAPKTVVRNLIKENNVVAGVQTDCDKILADAVIIADGANSLLAKEAGLRNEFKGEDMTLNVKEVYSLPKEKLEDVFSIDDNSGFAARIFGGPLKDMFAMGFMHTNKDTFSIGVGISIDELKKHKLKLNDLSDSLKKHPSISPYLKGAKLVEYSAHLIPEGRFDSIPKVYDNRIMIVGDAARFVNNMHLEGTNLAMLSGKLAGETALFALEKRDCSASVLKEYYRKLQKSIIIKDLKTHNNTVPFMKKHISTVSSYYPEMSLKLFDILSSADNMPKKDKYNKFLRDALSSGVIGKSLPLGFFALGKLFK